jgi:hypothetical protein
MKFSSTFFLLISLFSLPSASSVENEFFLAVVPDSAAAVFDESDNEITFSLKIADQSIDDLDIFAANLENCDGERFDSSIISVFVDTANKVPDISGSYYANVPIFVDIKTGNFQAAAEKHPTYFTENKAAGTVQIKFCLRAELGEITVTNLITNQPETSTISFTNLRFDMELDMVKKFVSSFDAVEESSSLDSQNANANINYESK